MDGVNKVIINDTKIIFNDSFNQNSNNKTVPVINHDEQHQIAAYFLSEISGLKNLITEKDKLLREKDRLIREKDRVIKIIKLQKVT